MAETRPLTWDHHPDPGMTVWQKLINLFNIIGPLLAVVAVAVWAWDNFLAPRDIVFFFVFIFLSAIGVTMGMHRYFSHRAFKTHSWFHKTLAILGMMAAEGDPIMWVADHRKHHQFSDQPGDPHSPHGHGPGLKGALKGLWHAHMGWIFVSHGTADAARYAPDLLKDPFLVSCAQWRLPITSLSFSLPFVVGWLWGGLLPALEMMLWAGYVRVFVGHHLTWAVNSIGHFWGSQRFKTGDESRNVMLLAPFTLGDSFHHNHHAFPTSAFHGLSRREELLDLNAWLLKGLEKAGVVWDVIRIPEESQAKRLLEAEA